MQQAHLFNSAIGAKTIISYRFGFNFVMNIIYKKRYQSAVWETKSLQFGKYR